MSCVAGDNVGVDYEELHRAALLPCVRVRAGKAGGSGTVIYSVAGNDGDHSTYVLTNYHVVQSLIEVKDRWDPVLQRDVKQDVRGLAEVHLFGYRWSSRAIGTTTIEADIAAYDVEEDLALLHLRSGQEMPTARLYPRSKETELRVGMPVFAVGAGLGEPPVITSGLLAQFGREIEHREYWLNSAPSIYGNSGGALFLARTGELIGVPSRIAVTAGFLGALDAITHLSFAIPITRIYQFFEDQLYRFIYDSSYTEESEAAERKRRREEDRLAILAQQQREGTE